MVEQALLPTNRVDNPGKNPLCAGLGILLIFE
jgi:hypothetical protein